MFEVEMKEAGEELVVSLKGQLDRLTAPEFGEKMNGKLDGVRKLSLDLAGLEYVSSAGLREFLKLQQIMDEQGEMVLSHVNDVIMDVFELSGFSDFMTFE